MSDDKIIIPQKELVELLQAWKQCRKDHTSGRPFFMLVQWVPIGANGGGRVVCRQVMSPVRVEESGQEKTTLSGG